MTMSDRLDHALHLKYLTVLMLFTCKKHELQILTKSSSAASRCILCNALAGLMAPPLPFHTWGPAGDIPHLDQVHHTHAPALGSGHNNRGSRQPCAAARPPAGEATQVSVHPEYCICPIEIAAFQWRQGLGSVLKCISHANVHQQKGWNAVSLNTVPLHCMCSIHFESIVVRFE